MNLGKFNNSFQKLNSSNYEIGEQKELQEFLDDFNAYLKEASEVRTDCTAEKRISRSSLERFENLWKRYRSYEVLCYISEKLIIRSVTLEGV